MEEVTLVTDLFDKKIGLRPPQGQMDIVTLSNISYLTPTVKKIKSKPFIIDSAGEYSLKGINIEGIESFQDNQSGEKKGRNTIFTIESEDIRLCHLGNLGHVLTEKQVEAIGEVDILLISAGDDNLTLKQRKEIVGQLEPGIIIPMNYKVKGLKTKDIKDCSEFCNEYGSSRQKKEKRLSVKAKDVKEMENNLVILDIN